MALQTSGAISLADIQTEFGGSNPISLSEYYGVASGIPASGAISISQFYGKSSGPTELATTQSSYWYSTNEIFSTDFNTLAANHMAYLFKNSDFVSRVGNSEYVYYSSSGAIQWHKRFAWEEDYKARLIGNKYGETLIIGNAGSSVNSIYFAIVDKSGTTTCQKSISSITYEQDYSVKPVADSNGDFICVYKNVMFKISRSNGLVTALKSFSSNNTALNYCMDIDSNDDIYTSWSDQLLYKLTASSGYNIAARYSSGSTKNFGSVSIDGNNNLYIGYERSNTAQSSAVSKYNSSMTHQWTKSTISNYNFIVVHATNNGVLVIGDLFEFDLKLGSTFGSLIQFITTDGLTHYTDQDFNNRYKFGAIANGHYGSNSHLIIAPVGSDTGRIAQVRPLGYPNQSGFNVYDNNGPLSASSPSNASNPLVSSTDSVTTSSWTSSTVSDVTLASTVTQSPPANLTKTAFNAYP